MVVNTKNKAICKNSLDLVKKILKIASKSRNIAYLNKNLFRRGKMADTLNVQQSLKKLLEGNKRCVVCKQQNPRQDARRRKEVSKGQKPFAVIVGCSDSRIPPELIFDQGLGDLFVVRLAGNIVDALALGSIEYAVEHLGTKLIVVLGHGKCGAVTAATKGPDAPGHVGAIVKAIQPAVKKVQKMPGDLVDNAIRANASLVVNKIKSSKPILAEMVNKGEIEVIGAYYNIETGAVELL
ncbi:MAG: mtcA2 [Deltaproteobacteria bacterium]|nr:mtcA2 [Deltaproteobacteria bacterium]